MWEDWRLILRLDECELWVTKHLSGYLSEGGSGRGDIDAESDRGLQRPPIHDSATGLSNSKRAWYCRLIVFPIKPSGFGNSATVPTSSSEQCQRNPSRRESCPIGKRIRRQRVRFYNAALPLIVRAINVEWKVQYKYIYISMENFFLLRLYKLHLFVIQLYCFI